MLRAYKVRIYPNNLQTEMLEKHFGCARFIWNWALAKRIALYETEKKSISRFKLSEQLPKMKADDETKWLGEVNAQSLQASLRNLECAYTSFFREKKGFPKFKAKHQRQSFQCPQRVIVDFKRRKISIPKCSKIRFRDDREFGGEIKTVTISRTPTRKYFASILVETGMEEPAAKKRIIEINTIGVDLGIKHFATLSTGEKVENPKHLKRSLRRLRRLGRWVSRKKKGSNNRNKIRIRLSATHERVSNQRRDFQHKLSTRLIRENQAVALESLNVSGMQKNRRLAQALNDAAWAQFVSMIEYKGRWYGKTILRIGRFEPSSKLCTCGEVNRELKLSDRTWTCGCCGAIHDRDILAANNIKRMALHPKNFLSAGSREFTPVKNPVRGSTKQELASEK